jgi:hypothetical protein
VLCSTNLPFRGRATPVSVRMLLVVLLATVGLAACGSSPTKAPSVPASAAPSVPAAGSAAAPARATPSGGGAGVHACALLPTADLSKIVGGEVPVATAMSPGGWVGAQCAWTGPTSGFFLRVGTAVSFATFGDPAAADAKAKLAQFKSAAGTAKDVAGIGDGAVLGTSGMAAYLGGTYLEVTRLRLTDDQLVAIMKLAVANLH